MRFEALAATDAPPLDELALALAAEFRPVDAPAALARLDALAAEVAPRGELDALVGVLARPHGFSGDRDTYDDPDNSMLDLVLERRRGLPILLSVVYVAAARRAGIPRAGGGLPGHFVVAPFGASPPLVLDPFGGGTRVVVQAPRLVRPWSPH